MPNRYSFYRTFFQFIPFILFLFGSAPLIAQDEANRRNPYIDQFLVGRINDAPLEQYEGSPYPVKQFESARVYLKDGSVSENWLRYNAYRDEMEFQKNEQTFEVVNKKDIDRIELGSVLYYCITLYDRENRPKMGYAQRAMGNDSLGLYLQKLVSFRPAKKHNIAGQGYTPDRFVPDQPRYHLIVPDRGSIPLSDRKKTFYEQLEQLSPDLAKMAKDQKIGANANGYREITTLLLAQ